MADILAAFCDAVQVWRAQASLISVMGTISVSAWCLRSVSAVSIGHAAPNSRKTFGDEIEGELFEVVAGSVGDVAQRPFPG